MYLKTMQVDGLAHDYGNSPVLVSALFLIWINLNPSMDM